MAIRDTGIGLKKETQELVNQMMKVKNVKDNQNLLEKFYEG